jgi:hypothetical protein
MRNAPDEGRGACRLAFPQAPVVTNPNHEQSQDRKKPLAILLEAKRLPVQICESFSVLRLNMSR